ncbi:nicotinic acid mononucleotide adenyltransferase [Cochleicola gelatinilyticus]|uniref:Nicotinic acid mononucleotide adenyltransferase n=1 Tax=Cochleicola gelatinilyticus TaxID=1763537 RepID=A0A167J662_9FLAO|nr:nicotinic acid mononucleotide adenyltransferase [Cochleicola gelatinilyticus]OAB80364.1 nicotinic acid mononucleotide adenyltransferase [Cochleicola gelatinilyticus]
MKTLKKISLLALSIVLFSSCYSEAVVEETYVDPEPTITLGELMSNYELWYVDIERTRGNGYIPFLQTAFTVSFRNGNLFANNNLVGIGDAGNGFGSTIGYYDTFNYELEISHDVNGYYRFEVDQLSSNEIRLYDTSSNLSYVLVGYQRNSFDYDLVFYDNIHYFLQEYITWEKIYTSEYGAINEFDNENFVQFLPGGGDGNFQSSQDPKGTHIENIYWDYTGIYNIDNVPGTNYRKYLTLDYDYLGNEYFELDVLDDRTIELYHNASGTVYRFRGKGFIQYKGTNKLRESKATIEKQMVKISNF